MGIKILVTNRKAFHEFEVGEKLEAGMVLTGTEVKSLRDGKANLNDAWVDIENNEAILLDCHISPYSHGNIMNHPEKRPRKLLLHRKEIVKLESKIAEKGLTLIPLKIYFKDQRIKLEIALAKGKKLHDKRDAAARKDADRQISKAMKSRNR